MNMIIFSCFQNPKTEVQNKCKRKVEKKKKIKEKKKMRF